MLQKIVDFLNSGSVEFINFKVGYLTGILVALAAIIAFIILRTLFYFIFFYPKKAKGVLIPTEHGSVFISAPAITDMIKTLEAEFKFISIRKVVLLDKKDFLNLDVSIDFDMEGGELPLISSAFQKTILSKLKDSFGIESVHEIMINVRKVSFINNKNF